MEIIRLNANTLKLIIDSENFEILNELFGYEMSIYNETLIDYLEECVDLINFIDSSEEKVSELVNFKVDNKRKRAYAIFVLKDRKYLSNHFMISFSTIDECISFSNVFLVKGNSKLIKYNNKYYFYFVSRLQSGMEYFIYEHMGDIIFDNINIARVLEHGKVIISEKAAEKLKLF